MSIINMASNNPFAGSTFFGKIDIDFEDLTEDFVNIGILRNFEPRVFMNYVDQAEWRDKWETYVQTVVLRKHRYKLVEKAIEYSTKAMQYYISQQRRPEEHKSVLDVWQLRIDYAKEILEDLTPFEPVQHTLTTQTEPEEKNPEFTLARQVLAIHYLLSHFGASDYDKTNVARFIQFLTGKELGAKNIVNTNIYKRLKNPFPKDNRTLKADLAFVRDHFEKIGLPDLALKLTKEIGTN